MYDRESLEAKLMYAHSLVVSMPKTSIKEATNILMSATEIFRNQNTEIFIGGKNIKIIMKTSGKIIVDIREDFFKLENRELIQELIPLGIEKAAEQFSIETERIVDEVIEKLTKLKPLSEKEVENLVKDAFNKAKGSEDGTLH